jgi:histidinol phosphatase-like enzyme
VSKKKAIIYDLDGTLANPKDHQTKHHIHSKQFAKAAENAPEIKKNVKKLKKDEKEGKDIVILTARSGAYKKETEKWLDKHDIEPDELIMRPKDDSKTPDKKVKEKLLKKKVLPKYHVTKAYDDRKKNVKMMKKHGIRAREV